MVMQRGREEGPELLRPGPRAANRRYPLGGLTRDATVGRRSVAPALDERYSQQRAGYSAGGVQAVAAAIIRATGMAATTNPSILQLSFTKHLPSLQAAGEKEECPRRPVT